MDLKTPVTILPCFKTEVSRTFDRKLKFILPVFEADGRINPNDHIIVYGIYPLTLYLICCAISRNSGHQASFSSSF